MNLALRYEIVKHIFAGFGVVPNTFINLDKSKSLNTKEFLLPETIPFNEENDKIIQQPIWGCQFIVEGHEVKVLLADCKQTSGPDEYALLVWMKDLPIYGIYLTYSDSEDFSHEALIACSMDGQQWLECQTYLQATFLAGTENLKSGLVTHKKCSDYKDQVNMLISFINFHMSLHGVGYEGQEN